SVFSFSGELRTLGCQFSLTLAEKFAHVFGHLRRLRKLLLGFVFEKCLHEVDKHRQGAVTTRHVVSKWFLLARITHPDAGDVCRRVTDEPNVSVVVDGSGFAGDWNRKHVRGGR